MADLKDFADKLVGLTVKEVNELANILKEEHGSDCWRPYHVFHNFPSM